MQRTQRASREKEPRVSERTRGEDFLTQVMEKDSWLTRPIDVMGTRDGESTGMGGGAGAGSIRAVVVIDSISSSTNNNNSGWTLSRWRYVRVEVFHSLSHVRSLMFVFCSFYRHIRIQTGSLPRSSTRSHILPPLLHIVSQVSSTLKSSVVDLTSLNSVIEAAAELIMLCSLDTISPFSFCLVSGCVTLSTVSVASVSTSRRHRFSGHC